MLHGPTSGSVGFPNFSNLFDPSSFRTGLTPSVTGQPSTFAPPSPATQALFAMMTNGNLETPGVNGGTSSAGLPHSLAANPSSGSFRSERDLPNHFDLGFRNLLDGKPVIPEVTSAIVNPVTSSMPPGMPLFATQPAPKPIGIVPAQPSPLKNGMIAPSAPYNSVHPAQVSGFQGPQNPLYLLTQAQQELNNDDDHIAAGVLSGLNASPYASSPEFDSMALMAPPVIIPASYAAANNSSPVSAHSSSNSAPTPTAPTTRKRKATNVPAVIDEDVPAAPRGRRKGTTKKQKVKEEDEDVDMEEVTSGGSKKPETEEEKRRNFLERNRQGAFFFEFSSSQSDLFG
jgi:ATF/CREB family transcription factor